MIMLPSIASSLCRKLGIHYSQFKTYNLVNVRAYYILRSERNFVRYPNTKLYRCLHTSSYYYDKNTKNSASLAVGDDKDKNLQKQKTLDNIIVKTETDANNTVTKVTIEKSKQESDTKQSVIPPSMLMNNIAF